MLRILSMVIFAAFALTGCGYSVVQKGAGPFAGRSMHLEMFANRTYQPDIEGRLRLFLVDELSASSSARLAESTDADLLVTGDVESLTIENAAFTQLDRAGVYRMVLTVQARVSDRKSGKILWKGTETVREEYPAGTDMALQRNARDTAISSVCKEMARHLVSQMNRAF